MTTSWRQYCHHDDGTRQPWKRHHTQHCSPLYKLFGRVRVETAGSRPKSPSRFQLLNQLTSHTQSNTHLDRKYNFDGSVTSTKTSSFYQELPQKREFSEFKTSKSGMFVSCNYVRVSVWPRVILNTLAYRSHCTNYIARGALYITQCTIRLKTVIHVEHWVHSLVKNTQKYRSSQARFWRIELAWLIDCVGLTRVRV